MHIEYTNGSPTVDTLDHLPPLPLFVNYWSTSGMEVTERDELGIYQVLRLHGRLRHIELVLPPSILHKVPVLLDGHFPILERLELSFGAPREYYLPLPLPKAFLAPNLRYLSLHGISPPRRLRVLTSTVSLVKLELSDIQISSYFHPRLLVARLRSLPQLEILMIGFSTPIPRPSTERKLLGGQGAPVTLSSLKILCFGGVSTYLESLVAQIRVPVLERLDIRLFNQIAFAIPHSFHLINITKAFKHPSARVDFSDDMVDVSTLYYTRTGYNTAFVTPFLFRVICKPLDWQIDCLAQICHGLIPTLSCVEKLSLYYHDHKTSSELRNGAIDSATWHDLLRSFIGVKEFHIDDELSEELSRALQVDEVGSDPGFLPNLLSIHARGNLFTSFIDTRQVVGRPVQFVEY